MKYELINGDCLRVLKNMDRVKCIFADPPDNIDLGYGEYKDKMPDEEYEALLEAWLRMFIARAEIVWFSFNARWTTAVGSILHRLAASNKKCNRESFAEVPDLEIKACVQVFTFGQHNKHDLGNNHRPLWRIRNLRKHDPRYADIYPDAIKVPSWRQRNGDKRAAEGGRVPGDVFDMQYPLDTEALLANAASQLAITARMRLEDARDMIETALSYVAPDIMPGDVFDFPRVTGNSKQRCDWHPTQLHEELVKRCILLSTSPTDRTIDPFGGTGTTMRVCRELDRPCTLIELDSNYCNRIADANGLSVHHQLLDGTPLGWSSEFSKISPSENAA